MQKTGMWFSDHRTTKITCLTLLLGLLSPLSLASCFALFLTQPTVGEFYDVRDRFNTIPLLTLSFGITLGTDSTAFWRISGVAWAAATVVWIVIFAFDFLRRVRG